MKVNSILIFALCTTLVFIGSANSATITVDGTDGAVAVDGVCSITEAITAANTDAEVSGAPGECNAGSGTDTINLSVNVILSDIFLTNSYGSTGTPSITSTVILDGMGFAITRVGACNNDEFNDDGEFRLILVQNTGDLTINNLSLNNGCADDDLGIQSYGGAIFNEGELSLNNSTVSGSSAYLGAGVFNDVLATISTIQNSTISGNTSVSLGGGIKNNGIITTVQNSTFSGNSASGSGGMSNSGEITTIQNTTFSGNSITGSDGFAIGNSGTIGTLSNSLFHQNTGSGSNECLNTDVFNGSNNISDSVISNCPGVIKSLTTATVGPLTDNGGPTMTHALLLGSEAINAGDGNSTTSDQRGTLASGIRDVGAFEALALELCPIALQADGFNTSVTTQSDLHEAIGCANLNGNSTDTINLSGDITLTAAFQNNGFGVTGTPVISSPIILDGAGNKLERDTSFNCSFVNQLAGEFRLIHINTLGNLTLQNMTLSNGCAVGNTNASKGGAIFNEGVLTISTSTISDNISRLAGGGIFNTGTISKIEYSTVSENESGKTGGGIRNNGTINTIENSTFSGNSALQTGGGINNIGVLTSLQNVTFSENTATDDGTGISNSGSIDMLSNSLFHQNSGGGTECVNTDTFNGSNNLSDDVNSDCPDVSTTLTTATVSPLADNGGPTMTHALNFGSQAIDAGNSNASTDDQRGVNVSEIRDIGAYEASSLFELCPVIFQTDGFTTSVSDSAILNKAIQCANLNGNGTDTIILSDNITITSEFQDVNLEGSTGTPAITSPIILDGMGFSIERDSGLTCDVLGNNGPDDFRLIRVLASGDLRLSHITLRNGCAIGSGSGEFGGAIFNQGNLFIENSNLSENTAFHGAGIYNTGDINSIQNSTFSENFAQNSGGGISNSATGNVITIQNSTISGNTALIFGGGIVNFNTITTIQNSTFSGNFGGGISSFDTIGNLSNSLFHKNIAGNDCLDGNNGTFNGSNNLSDNVASDCPGVATTLTDTTVGPLADNGGLTMTHALLQNSEAIDAGDANATTHDQRGFAAFVSRDIGAFEFLSFDACPMALLIDGFTTSVSSPTELYQAIECANLNGNATDTINLSSNMTLTVAYENHATYGHTGIPAITGPIILNGMDFSIVRDDSVGCTLNTTSDLGEFRIIRIGATADLTLNNITLSNGCADGNGSSLTRNGGAIFNEGVLSLDNTTISDNSSDNRGGGIDSRIGSSINIIQNSTFSGNKSDSSGGGIFNSGTISTIQNSTFSANDARFSGGGIDNRENITTIQNSTFSGNSASNFGGGIKNEGTIDTLRNSLFHQNTDDGTECTNVGMGSIGGSNNLSDTITSNCPGVSTTLTTATIGLLSDNGGPTLTHALLPGSEALDTAIGGTASDQRSFATNGNRDIGAFEAQALELCPDVLQTDGFTTSVADPTALNQAIECANANGPDEDTINLNADIVLTTSYEGDASTGTHSIASALTLDGMGFKLARNGSFNCNFNSVNSINEFRILRVATMGSLAIKNIRLSNGCADGIDDQQSGGAILNDGVLSIENSTLSNNEANFSGGGIINNGTITIIQNTTFFENLAISNGGGIINNGTITVIQNTTFSKNLAISNGGGIRNNDTINSILNNTFSGNSAGANGAAIRNSSGTINMLKNTLFHRTANSTNECNSTGGSTFIGNNNLSDNLASNCPGVSMLTTATVGSLANHGGLTNTHALKVGSEAIDAGDGDSTLTDQRGFLASGTRDIGAFEVYVPIIMAPAGITEEATAPLSNPALGTATATDVDSDNASIVIINDASSFAVGIHSVTWTATDKHGHFDTATQSVTIVDTTPPIVSAPPAINMEATGPTTVVNLGSATASDIADGSIVPTANTTGPFAIGVHTITWSATDNAGLSGTATQIVTIIDSTSPEITLTGANPQMIQETESYTELGATATDLVDDDTALTATIVIDDSDVDTDIPGMYEVTYNVMDTAGNEADTVTRTIEVTADIPVANNDSYNTNEDTILNSVGSVLTNDNDPDNDGLTVVTTGISTMVGLGGSINMLANGTFTYTPVADAVGTDVLNYEITDGTHTVTSTITIEVNPVNDAPTFTVMGNVDVTGLVDAIDDFVEVSDFIENIVFGPADESGQSIDSITAGEIDPDNVISAVSINNNGQLRVDINIGNYGAAIIQVQLKDDGGTANNGEDTSQIVEFMVIYDDRIFGNGFEDTSEKP